MKRSDTVTADLPTGTVIVGDALEELHRLPNDSIDMVLTSPPYFRLRDYGRRGQIGLEVHVDDWAARLMPIAREVQRVLTPSGTFWLNLGDTYSVHPEQGAARKSLLLAPERVALALCADGWVLRNKIVWAKTNPRPTSVRDRLACTWEPLYVLALGPHAFFDLDAVRQPHRTRTVVPSRQPSTRPAGRADHRGPNADRLVGLDQMKAGGIVGHPLGKNPGDVWHLASGGLRGHDHPAVFPIELAARAIQAGCPELRCSRCHLPYRRTVHRDGRTATRGPLQRQCGCENVAAEPGIVLDPFIGSGTTAVAATTLGRNWLGIELNPDYADLARQRGHEARAGS